MPKVRVSPRFQRNRVSRMWAGNAKSPSTVRRSSRHPSSTPESLVDDCCVVDTKPGTCNNAHAPRPRPPGLDILRLALAFRNLQPGRPRGRIGEDRAAQTPRGRRHATPRRSASRCHPRGGMAMPSVPPSDLLCLPVSVGHEERLKRMVVSGRCRASALRSTLVVVRRISKLPAPTGRRPVATGQAKRSPWTSPAPGSSHPEGVKESACAAVLMYVAIRSTSAKIHWSDGSVVAPVMMRAAYRWPSNE